MPLINNKYTLVLGKDDRRDKRDQSRLPGFLETGMKADRKIQHGTPEQSPGAAKHSGIYRKQEMISNSGAEGTR